MAYRLPPLASLRLFEAAARHTSFKRAADELGLTPSAVSHGIAALEDWMATPLFRRDGRALSLTPAGADLLPYIGEGLSLIATGARRVSPALGTRCIRLSVAPTFARRWLIPRLARFRARQPDVDLHIDSTHARAVLPLEGVDIAVRMGAGPWPASRCDLLFRESLLPVAAPAYLEGVRAADGGVDWDRADPIHVVSVDHDWRTWREARGLDGAGGRAIHVDTVELALDAAAAGLGVALCRLPLCRAALDGSALRALPVEPLAIPTGYWAALPEGREPRREVDAFLSWLREEANTDDY